MRDAAEELLEELSASFPLKQRPLLVWRRMPSSAGKAYYHLWQISLSSVLITDEERLKVTLTHEYAHLLAFERHGRTAGAHGPAWRQAMSDLGAPPIVCHNYEVERRVIARNLLYKCSVCGHEIPRVRPLKRGYIYTHQGCGGTIRKA
jgi:predicted SprT family Zn-dependent metalloprotease